jgi:hypothetical protein
MWVLVGTPFGATFHDLESPYPPPVRIRRPDMISTRDKAPGCLGLENDQTPPTGEAVLDLSDDRSVAEAEICRQSGVTSLPGLDRTAMVMPKRAVYL